MKTHKLSALTIERLTDIKFNILAVPETFRMESEFQAEEESPCGTAACIAGHACAVKLSTKTLDQAYIMTGYGSDSPMVWGRLFLDLDREQAGRLFFLSEHVMEGSERKWPDEFEERYMKAKTAKARAKVAAERIEHFIKTDGEE